MATGLSWKSSWAQPRVAAAKPPVTAAPTPAPPPQITPGVQPPDAIYEMEHELAGNQYAQSLQRAQYQRGQLGTEYGIGQDPSGNVFYDNSNPYARSAMMQQVYDRSRASNTNSYAARGQLYAGSLQDAQNEAARQFGQNRDQLLRSFLAAQAGIKDQELAAGNALQDRIAGAASDSITRALANARGS